MGKVDKRMLRRIRRANSTHKGEYNSGMVSADRSTHGGVTAMELCALIIVHRQLLHLRPGREVTMLDLGCGSGVFLATCAVLEAEPWCRLVGVDMNERRCKIAAKLLEATSLPRFRQSGSGWKWEVLPMTMVPSTDPTGERDVYHRALVDRKRAVYIFLNNFNGALMSNGRTNRVEKATQPLLEARLNAMSNGLAPGSKIVSFDYMNLDRRHWELKVIEIVDLPENALSWIAGKVDVLRVYRYTQVTVLPTAGKVRTSPRHETPTRLPYVNIFDG